VKWVINTGRDMSVYGRWRARVSIQPDYLVLVEREIYEHDGVVTRTRIGTACVRTTPNFRRVRPDVPKLSGSAPVSRDRV
jgi:hypothetical protein